MLLNVNAVLRFAFWGPRSRVVRRRRRRAVFETRRRSREVARVVREGWMERVAARERCWWGGTKAAAGEEAVRVCWEEVPAVRRLRRRFRPWVSF